MKVDTDAPENTRPVLNTKGDSGGCLVHLKKVFRDRKFGSRGLAHLGIRSIKLQRGMMGTRTLIVDDHPAVRLGLRSLISQEEDFEVVGEAASIAEAIEQASALQPDIAIVDITFERGREGLELVRRLSNEMKILVCSYHDERLFAERALVAGARGYIQKGEVLDEVVNALRRITKGDIYLSSRMAQHLLRVIEHKRDDGGGPPIEELSNRELEVFRLLGYGCETREVAAKLNLSPKTVAKHCENIMAKLNIQSKTKLLYHAVVWLLEEQSS